MPYEKLYEANLALGQWCGTEGHELAGCQAGDRLVGATRLEIYHRDPDASPDSEPTTEVAFRLVD